MDGYLPIGDRVRELRRRRGLSQLRFGALIDRSENWVSKAERGEIPIDRLSVLVRIAEALKVSPGELIADPRVSHDEAESPMRAGIAGVRRAVLVPPSPQRIRSLEELDAALIDANQVWNRVAITATLGLLPGLLGELDAAAREGNESAVRLLGQGYGFVSAVMTRLAGDRREAERRGDRVLRAR
jgi:transcriptional regulator with XRE-family HTH domain